MAFIAIFYLVLSFDDAILFVKAAMASIRQDMNARLSATFRRLRALCFNR